jgi:ankyrin repeat protein
MAVLIEHGADVNYMAKNWGTPLVRAVRFNAKEKVLYLLEHGADPTIRIPVRKMTPAEYAQNQGHQELYEILKEAEAAHAEH